MAESDLDTKGKGGARGKPRRAFANPTIRKISAVCHRIRRRRRSRNKEMVQKVDSIKKYMSTAWQSAAQGVGFTVAFSAAMASSFVLFRVLNKMKVQGLENLPTAHENVLYCINHCSLLDNFAFEMAAYVPKVFFKREYIPISLADRKNFFGDPTSPRLKDKVLTVLGRHFFRHLKAYPVDRKCADMGQVEQWRDLLKDNIVIVFPEGTRTRNGKVGRGKPGVGKLIYEAKPVVVPVYMSGTAEVLGVGMTVPAVFRTVRVFIGKPMSLENLLDKYEWNEENKTTMMRNYIGVSNAVMEEIRRLNPDYVPDSEATRERPLT